MIDYIALNPDIGLVAPEVALLLAAFLILVFIPFRRMPSWAPGIAFIGLVVSFIFALQQWFTDPQSGFAGMVTCDDFGIAFKLLFILTAFLTLFIAQRFLKAKGLDKPEFYALLLFSAMGMMAMANTTDLVVMFLGLEIMSVPLYVMAGLNRRNLESNEAGIKYFFMGAFATAFLLMGIAFVYGASESTNLRRIVADFSYIAASNPVYLYGGISLILIGFGFKVAIVPFHTWVPDVYQGAPTPVTGFFSVGPKAAGFAVLLRIFMYGFAEVSILPGVFWVLAVLTMTVGNVLALRQDNVKRMLAYSSIAHAGYILVALTVGGGEAIAAAFFYLVAYMVFSLGAFAVVTAMETRSGMRSDFTELAGLSKAHPFLSASLALFMFALSGFPPTVGFFGKFYIFAAAVKSGYIFLAVMGVLNSFLSVYYYLRVIKVSYFDQLEGTFVPVPVSPTMFVALCITVIGTLGLGLFPQQLLHLSQSAIFAFL